MRVPTLPLIALLISPLILCAQPEKPAPFQIYGGFAYFSNSFNGVPGSQHPLSGWDSAVALPSWHNLRLKVEASGYYGNNLGGPQRAISVLTGLQYEWSLSKERLFVEALVGNVGLNRNWGANGSPGGTSSFAELLGGGLDTPVSKHIGIRVEGGMQHSNFALVQSLADPVPYRIPGLPSYFGRISAGVVWTPGLGTRAVAEKQSGIVAKEPVQSELIFETSNCFGHITMFADMIWSYFNYAGVEYDRNSWGKFIGARMDYAAEILPVAILRQPSKTDVWGNPLSKSFETLPGLGILPFGMRMIWRDGKTWKPYFITKFGMIGFTKKAISQYASYQNMLVQQSVGIQFRLNDRWDARTGIGVLHISNFLMVPSDPGTDQMLYTVGLSYHFKTRRARF
jgi:hypothetical protein